MSGSQKCLLATLFEVFASYLTFSCVTKAHEMNCVQLTPPSLSLTQKHSYQLYTH